MSMHPVLSQLDPNLDLIHAEMKAANRHHLLSTLETRETGANFDIHYERMEWSIDPAVNYIRGSVTTYVNALESLDHLAFDLANNMQIDSIIYHGQQITTYTQTDNQTLEIPLPSSIEAGTRDSIQIAYQGVPGGGGFGYWVQSAHQETPIIWTLSEPYGALQWWPCKQDLNDKIDSMDILVTTPQPYRVASNGLLVEEKVLEDGSTRYHWQTHYPIAAYLVALGITNYAVYSDYVPVPGHKDIEVLNYVYPENLNTAMTQTSQVVPVMQLYNELFGLYPFAEEKYGHAQFGWGGGMEHQTMTFANSFSFLLVSHELAHQWFGDKVTCGSWQDIWLNEGFATYCEGLCYEHGLGNQDWQEWLKNKINIITSAGSGSVFVEDTSSVNRIFDARLTYYKGALLLHMLRWKLGDANFFRGIREYLSDPELSYQFARTAQLQSHLEAASGQDLTDFFQTWYYGQGFPSYHILWDQTGDSLKLTIAQSTSHPSVEFFALPVPILVEGPDRDTLLVLPNDHSGQTFTVRLGFQATSLQVDPDHWLISAANTVTRETSARPAQNREETIKVFPNPASSYLYISKPQPTTGTYTISDLSGRIIQQGTLSNDHLTAISVASLASGIYLLQVGDVERITTTRFLKVH